MEEDSYKIIDIVLEPLVIDPTNDDDEDVGHELVFLEDTEGNYILLKSVFEEGAGSSTIPLVDIERGNEFNENKDSVPSSSSTSTNKRPADLENQDDHKRLKSENFVNGSEESSPNPLSDDFTLSFDFLRDVFKEIESGVIPENPLANGCYFIDIDMEEFDKSDKPTPTLNDLMKAIPIIKYPGEFNPKQYRKHQRIVVSLTCIQAVPKFKFHHQSPLYSPENNVDNSEDICNSSNAGRHAAGPLATASMGPTAEIVFILGDNMTHFPEWARDRIRTGLHNFDYLVTCFYKFSLYKSPPKWWDWEMKVNKILERWARYKVHTCEVIRNIVLLQKQDLVNVPINYSHLDSEKFGKFGNEHFIKRPGNLEHKCKICKQVYNSASVLCKHKLTHPEYVYDCEHCGTKLLKRERIIVGGKPRKLAGQKHKCDPKLKEFFMMQSVKDKLGLDDSKFPKFPFMCAVCSSGFGTKADLTQHEKRAHGPKTLLCSQCSLGFGTKGNLNEHVKRAHSPKTLLCSQCPLGFGSTSLLNEHVKRAHSPKTLLCSQCSLGFSIKSKLNEHVKRAHSPKTLLCSQCSLGFSTKSDLTRHVKRAHGPKILCSQCSLGFTTTFNLNRHVQQVHKPSTKVNDDHKEH